MSQGTIARQSIQIASTATNAVVAGALWNFYVAGLSTRITVYADVALTTPLSNPVVADGYGRFPEVFLAPGVAYDENITTSAGVSLPGYPASNLLSVPTSSSALTVTGTMGVAATATQVVYLSDGSNSKTAGQWFLADADFTYASTLPEIGFAAADIAISTSGSIQQGGRLEGFTGLTVGAAYYVSATAGAITATAPANAMYVGQADSTTSLIIDPASPNLGGDLTFTAGEAVTAGQVGYLSDGSGSKTGGQVYLADADFTYASNQAIVVGIVLTTATLGAVTLLRVIGRVRGLSGLTAGLTYYASATAGALTATAPVNRRVVGTADSTTSLILGPDRPKVELLGAISGTTQAAAASSVSIASLPSGTLTAKDRIVLEYTIESITQLTAASGFYNNTDAVLMAKFNGGNAIQTADTIVVGRYTIQQAQSAATRIISHDLGTPIGSSPNGTVAESAISTFTQNWTGAWELALRIGAVTAGGTCRYSVLALIERGQ